MTTNQPPLNPDAIEHAIKEVYGDGPRMDWPSDMTGYQTHRDYARTIVEQIASAYLAVAQPVVNSVEELDKLPEGSVFIDDDGSVCQIKIDGDSHFNGDPYRRFSMVGDFKDYELDEVTFPARVLYLPTEEPSNGR